MSVRVLTLFWTSFCLFTCLTTNAQPATRAEVARWQQQANQVSITRDTWGVPHISGKTDADAVFGLIYTQCEDDFDRVEMNYITSTGRLAEIEGESALYHDLRQRMFIDSTQAVALYRKSPAWLKKLLDAFADGANYYLHTHPAVKPKLLTRFQPWMPLMFSEGSIGGNISSVSLEGIRQFYTQSAPTGAVLPGVLFDPFRADHEPTGSNGFAIAPAKSANGHALLLINPHTSFYFRSEVHVKSGAGLNVYGAVTWGQFFVYQGFNENCGWMHTTSYADSMDEYLETVEKRNGKYVYKHGNDWRPVETQRVSLPYRANGGIQRKDFTIYRTHHGPVAGRQGDRWVTVRMMNDAINALSQSYLRTKATNYASYRDAMKLNGNASNNTIYADKHGTIAYWHGNFMPRRDTTFNWEQPVEGSNPRTDWQGLHPIDDIVQVKNPASGWIQNCNATPFTVSGSSSPARNRYPAYMAPDDENYRGLNAVRVLSRRSKFTLDTLIAAANDPYLTAFAQLVPTVVKAFEATPNLPNARALTQAIDTLRRWNYQYGVNSIAQTVATYWAENLQQLARSRIPAGQRPSQLAFMDIVIDQTSAEEKLNTLAQALERLNNDFGTWKTPWGNVNRYQRLTGAIDETYDDSKPSLPVGFTSSAWGSLAAYGARTYPGTKKRYGNVGNSFVAVVEFGPKVRARSVVTGGQDSRPGRPHFVDQAPMYCNGQFKDVWFYPEDIQQHAAKTYKPGEI